MLIVEKQRAKNTINKHGFLLKKSTYNRLTNSLKKKFWLSLKKYSSEQKSTKLSLSDDSLWKETKKITSTLLKKPDNSLASSDSNKA